MSGMRYMVKVQQMGWLQAVSKRQVVGSTWPEKWVADGCHLVREEKRGKSRFCRKKSRILICIC